MPLTTLNYNDNVLEHRGFADTLGQMQGLIDKGRLDRNTSHAYYAGHELRSCGVSWSGHFLKRDCPGNGKTTHGRSQNRVIVNIDANGNLVENWAVAWRHDNRLLQLDAGFFTRAQQMRKLVNSL